VLVEVQKLVP